MRRFTYAPSQLASLEKAISSERIGTYLRACGGNFLAAIQMYEKNTDLSEALYGVLQALEITLRNSMHRELTSHFGVASWFDQIALLRAEAAALGRAKKSLRRAGRPQTPGRIVAELSFGFWVGLTSRPYSQKTWIPCLHKAFPFKRLAHRTANNRLEEIRRIRNRIAHHEPIMQPSLADIYRKIVETLEWVCPETALWMRETTRFEQTFLTHIGHSPFWFSSN
jgi:Abi-like protein